MSPCSRRAWLAVTGGLSFAGALGLTGRSAFADATVRLQIVTAKANSIRDISFPDLRQLYRGKRISVAGVKVIPFNHPAGTPDRVGFDRVVLGMSPDEVGRYWVDQKIRGGEPPPRTIDSAALLLRVVAALPGSLGYVREGFSSPELKIVSIEGRLPGDSGYPLAF
jgi:hypothetical protein